MQQLLLNQVPAQYSLKCQIASELGRCHRYLARPKLEVQVYQRALQLCSNGQRSSERFGCLHLVVLTIDIQTPDSCLQCRMLIAGCGLPGICFTPGRYCSLSVLWICTQYTTTFQMHSNAWSKECSMQHQLGICNLRHAPHHLTMEIGAQCICLKGICLLDRHLEQTAATILPMCTGSELSHVIALTWHVHT